MSLRIALLLFGKILPTPFIEKNYLFVCHYYKLFGAKIIIYSNNRRAYSRPVRAAASIPIFTNIVSKYCMETKESLNCLLCLTAAAKNSLLAALIGSAGGDSILRGLIGVPFFQTRKSRWGPVERPVLPTYPITSPWRTLLPTANPLANRERCRYAVVYVELCRILT